MLLGLRTAVYPVQDLGAAKAWYTKVIGHVPYFDQPFYAGFNVGGYELGLDPDSDPADGAHSYWGVEDAAAAGSELIAFGATVVDPVREVGDGIKTGSFRLPDGALFCVIENPHFELPA